MEYVTGMQVWNFEFISDLFGFLFLFFGVLPNFFMNFKSGNSGVCWCWGPAVSGGGVDVTGCRLLLHQLTSP